MRNGMRFLEMGHLKCAVVEAAINLMVLRTENLLPDRQLFKYVSPSVC